MGHNTDIHLVIDSSKRYSSYLQRIKLLFFRSMFVLIYVNFKHSTIKLFSIHFILLNYNPL